MMSREDRDEKKKKRKSLERYYKIKAQYIIFGGIDELSKKKL